MYLFENSIVIEASVQACVKAWRDCADAWVANEDFLDFEPLASLLTKNNIPIFPEKLTWDIAANGNEGHQVLWWQHNHNSIDASGVIAFDEINSNGHSRSRVTLKITFFNSFHGVDSLNIETNTSLAMQRMLKQFKRIVSSNVEQDVAGIHAEELIKDKLKKAFAPLMSKNLKKEVLYANV